MCDADKVVVRTGLAKQNDNEEEEKNKEKVTSEEAKKRTERCRHYWNVERHCFEKLEKVMGQQQDVSNKRAVPSFLGVFGDDGSGLQSDVMDGYGVVGERNEGAGGWFNNDEAIDGHEWMVFESVESIEEGEGAMTLLDAMEVRICIYVFYCTTFGCFYCS